MTDKVFGLLEIGDEFVLGNSRFTKIDNIATRKGLVNAENTKNEDLYFFSDNETVLFLKGS
tara:strand:+ start:2139 stop:2321 length:183 start_codon:yes stop_codon:yes gene_type:complete